LILEEVDAHQKYLHIDAVLAIMKTVLLNQAIVLCKIVKKLSTKSNKLKTL